MRRVLHFITGHGDGFMLMSATGVWCVEECTCGKRRLWRW